MYKYIFLNYIIIYLTKELNIILIESYHLHYLITNFFMVGLYYY
jgi:hypothetical protein